MKKLIFICFILSTFLFPQDVSAQLSVFNDTILVTFENIRAKQGKFKFLMSLESADDQGDLPDISGSGILSWNDTMMVNVGNFLSISDPSNPENFLGKSFPANYFIRPPRNGKLSGRTIRGRIDIMREREGKLESFGTTFWIPSKL